MNRIEVLQADITELDVDAIVNAANEWMLGGGGVDGAIHNAAGPKLVEACRRVPEVQPGIRCPTGEARITIGGSLPAAFVIHTVGPVWSGGSSNEPVLLASCYRNALILLDEKKLKTIAFPAISCGVFSYPEDQAAAVAVKTIKTFLAINQTIERVLLIAFDGEMENVLVQAVKNAVV